MVNLGKELPSSFFDQRGDRLAVQLLGKVLRRKVWGKWLSVQIIETEAYLVQDRASHSWLGRTPSREAMFMRPGTLYMYHSRGGDSLNISCKGAGSAVLIKSGWPMIDVQSPVSNLEIMHELSSANSRAKGASRRKASERLCAGQSLLCRALNLRRKDWNEKQFDPAEFYLEDIGYRPRQIIVTCRIGIPPGRDEHRLLRFIDESHITCCTSNPLRKRGSAKGQDYRRLKPRSNGSPVRAATPSNR